MSTFIFNPSSAVDAAAYEAINILKSSPKNPQDFYDLQQILRYRMVSLVKELFGNCRTSPLTGIEYVTKEGDKFFKVTGSWYLDGYKVEVKDLYSAEHTEFLPNHEGYLGLRFKEDTILKTALVDEITKKPIYTSTRISFDPILVVCDGYPSDDYEGYVFYKIFDATYADNVFTFEDAAGISYVNVKYNEALEIINNAVHAEEIDGKDVVEIKKLTTNKDVTKACIELEEVDETKSRISFKSETGDVFGGIEIVKLQGQWQPIMWMQPSMYGMPVSYMTPDGFSIVDENGSVSKYSNKEIRMGGRFGGLYADTQEFDFRPRGVPGLKSKAAYVSNNEVIKTLTGAPANVSTYVRFPGYEASSLIDNTHNAVYSFGPIHMDDLPIDFVLSYNHSIAVNANAGEDSIITAVVEQSPDNSSWNFSHRQTWLSNGPLLQEKNPFLAKVVPADDNLFIRITYSITPVRSDKTVSAAIAFAQGKNLSWNTYTSAFGYFEGEHALINGHLIWVDTNGYVRVKKVTSDIGSDINNMHENEAGSSITDPGGMIIGSDNTLESVEMKPDITGTYNKPTYVSSTKDLYFPVVNETMDNAERIGLVSVQTLKNLVKTSSNEPLTATPAWAKNYCYVGKDFLSTPAQGNIYKSSVADAVTWLLGTYGGGTVIVLPGHYVEEDNINLTASASYTNGSSIAIVAFDTLNTSLIGKLTDGGKPVNAFIDIPIRSLDSSAVEISHAGSNITFGTKAKINSNNSAPAVVISKGRVEFNSTIWHIVPSGVDDPPSEGPSIQIGNAGLDLDDAMVTFNELIGGQNPKGILSIYSGTVKTYKMVQCDSAPANSTSYIVNVSGANATSYIAYGPIISLAGLGLASVNKGGSGAVEVEFHGTMTHSRTGSVVSSIYVGDQVKCLISSDVRVVSNTDAQGCAVDNRGETTLRRAKITGWFADAVQTSNNNLVVEHSVVDNYHVATTSPFAYSPSITGIGTQRSVAIAQSWSVAPVKNVTLSKAINTLADIDLQGS
jgi:hypothetical protein